MNVPKIFKKFHYHPLVVGFMRLVLSRQDGTSRIDSLGDSFLSVFQVVEFLLNIELDTVFILMLFLVISLFSILLSLFCKNRHANVSSQQSYSACSINIT